MKNTPKTRTSAQRYNARMEKIWNNCRRIEAERVARGEEPNPNLNFVLLRVNGQQFADLYEAEEYARRESSIMRDSVSVLRGTATLCQWTDGRKNWQNPETKSQFPIARAEVSA